MKKKPDIRSPRDFMPTPRVPKEPIFDFPKDTMKDRDFRRRFYERLENQRNNRNDEYSPDSRQARNSQKLKEMVAKKKKNKPTWVADPRM